MAPASLISSEPHNHSTHFTHWSCISLRATTHEVWGEEAANPPQNCPSIVPSGMNGPLLGLPSPLSLPPFAPFSSRAHFRAFPGAASMERAAVAEAGGALPKSPIGFPFISQQRPRSAPRPGEAHAASTRKVRQSRSATRPTFFPPFPPAGVNAECRHCRGNGAC